MMLRISFALFLSLIPLCVLGKKIRNFRVSPEITTGWTFCRSQALYTSEFLYNQDKEVFWNYFENLNNKKSIKQAGKSSKQDQSSIFDILPFKSTSEMARLLKLNMEMETFAPKFEAIAQSQATLINAKCNGLWIEYQSGVFACSIDSLEGKDISGVKSSVYDYLKTDKSDPNSVLVRIYTIPGLDLFNKIFDELNSRGFRVAVQLVPKPSKCPFYQDEVHPTGYGLEFELKSSQYVVEEPQEELPDDETDNLQKSFSQQETLKSFKDINEVEMLQGRAIKNLLKSSSFDEILETSTNIPLISDKLSQIEINQESQSSDLNQMSHFRINNLELKSSNIDPFRLIDFINIYNMINNGISKTLKHRKSSLKKILKSRLTHQNSNSKTRYNIQSSAISYLNDLEKDQRYSMWAKSLSVAKSLGEREFVAKNILTVIFPIDISNSDSTTILDNLVQLISYGFPMRFALIPIVKDDEKVTNGIKAYYAVRESYGLRASLAFLNNLIKLYQTNVNPEEMVEFLSNQMKLEVNVEDGNEFFNEAKELCEKFNIKIVDEIFVNGMIFSFAQNLPEILLDQYKEELSFITENLADSDDIYSNVLLKHDARTERTLVDMSLTFDNDQVLSLKNIESLLSIKNYFKTSKKDELKLTCWIAAEFDKKETFSFLLKALKIKTSAIRTRIFVPSAMTSMPNRIVLAASAILSESPESIQIVTEFLEEFYGNYFGGSVKVLEELKAEDKIIKKLLKYAADLSKLEGLIKENDLFFSIFGEVADGTVLFTLNGNTLLLNSDNYNLDDILQDELDKRSNRLFNVAKEEKVTNVSESVLVYAIFEKKLLKKIDDDLSNLISTPTTPFPSNNLPPLRIGDDNDSVFHVEAIFNPFNREGQKFSSIMGYFTNTNLFSFKLHFITNLSSKDPKEARIYRFVTPETKGVPIPVVPVGDEETLMAMSLDLPAAWMVVATFANSDLDNIRPIKVPHLQASFSLNNIIIEGQAMLGENNEEAATGKIIQLYNSVTGLLEDETSVMANFGYYQLKASPGTWSFRALSAKSENEEESLEYPIEKGNSLVLTSFGGKFNRLRLKKDPIKLSGNILTKKQADLNVFSLASGLFYERLLRIMIFSVMKQKEKDATVKFWLLGSTLSAQGTLALETLSKELGFEYELMAYNWPSWLNPQTRKHRTIWAYKILFLDVLFPQSLDRIIFIDADQVVRSNLMELVNLDLKGHVYAMTPFCKDKDEMAPYRFWEHNYWKNHLNGRPYHISALFVVDLLELRRKLVADIIRSQYHMLSQDPNSLSNLDQDLPNNLQAHIPIYSLPQEWLWCDTWCSQATKSKAKTIDLCNNPKTFESKIDQATRIIPEWKDYDEEVKNILEKGRKEYLKNLRKNMKGEIEHYEL